MYLINLVGGARWNRWMKHLALAPQACWFWSFQAAFSFQTTALKLLFQRPLNWHKLDAWSSFDRFFSPQGIHRKKKKKKAFTYFIAEIFKNHDKNHPVFCPCVAY